MNLNSKNISNKKNWYIINANNMILGRLASKISFILQGKHKSEYKNNLDLGDYVIVINAVNIKVTGNKFDNKIYYKHTGYVGKLKKIKYKDMLEINYKYILLHAVKGMLPKNKLRKKFIKKLKIYKDSLHNHQPQKNIIINLN